VFLLYLATLNTPCIIIIIIIIIITDELGYSGFLSTMYSTGDRDGILLRVTLASELASESSLRLAAREPPPSYDLAVMYCNSSFQQDSDVSVCHLQVCESTESREDSFFCNLLKQTVGRKHLFIIASISSTLGPV